MDPFSIIKTLSKLRVWAGAEYIECACLASALVEVNSLLSRNFLVKLGTMAVIAD